MVTKRVRLHAGQCRELRVRCRVRGPVKHFEVLDLGLDIQVPRDKPEGRGLS
jgi:hypothetical protein